ncbi:flagellar export chaperone FliS [Cohnella sp. CFH 77786]|uniref:flagellar export chaperone FliS n=1 Tax=Cohnella sp. CFH 77786 TaxID=2662265 RepID=UPI001C609BBC|nr:flagellar export chaperone FliS [Cohnella sp. CFH 77786]MBW5448469.1 flagellar export chaperone FliS [Cohnella sp. CFH 77786]
MNQQAHETYLRMQVNTAAPWELTTLLYNGCIKFMKQALEGIHNKDFEMKNINIKKATNIINELQYTLDKKYEVSNSLSSIYDYLLQKLFVANMKLDAASLAECIELMTDLKDAWVQSMKQLPASAKVRS